MKFKNIFVALGVCCSVTLVSCEDFLTQTNPNSMNSELFYSSYSDCEKGLASVYSAFKDPSIYQPLAENLRTDLCVESNSKRTTFTNVFYLQTFNNATQEVIDKWRALYTAVFRTNLLLEGLQKATPSFSEAQIADAKVLEAEAHFFRGLFYFWLHNSYNNGAVPIISTVAQQEADFYTPVSSSDKVQEFYRAELQKALDLGLVDKWEDAKFLGRVTSWSAKAVLGKSYLYEGDYTTAATYFKDIIDNGGFELADVSENMTTKGEFNSESILEVAYSTEYNTLESADKRLFQTWGMNFAKVGGWAANYPAMWLVDAYENEYVDPEDIRNWVAAELDDEGDMIYTQKGKKFEKEYLSTTEANVMIHQTYVNRKLAEDSFEAKPTKKLKKFDATTGVATGEVPTYTYEIGSHFYDQAQFANRIPGKEIDGSYYRLRQFSRRASYSLALNGDEDLEYYGEYPGVIAVFNNNETGYFRKLVNWDIRTNEQQGSPSLSSSINLRLIRLADIYLMYAESLIEGGNEESGVQEALNYINRVRQRAGVMLLGEAANGEFANATYEDEADPTLGYVPMSTAEQVMDHLMYKERPMELCIEGYALRAIDLRRWNVAKERFEKLSKEIYSFQMTTYYKPTEAGNELISGNTAPYANWCDQKPEYLNPTANWKYSDYKESYMNFSAEQDSYFPIPTTEITSNPEID